MDADVESEVRVPESEPAVGYLRELLRLVTGLPGDGERALLNGSVSSSPKSLGSSGVREGQLERELSSDIWAVGELALELVVGVFVDRDLEERSGSSVASVACGCSSSSSMTSTTLPSGATTS